MMFSNMPKILSYKKILDKAFRKARMGAMNVSAKDKRVEKRRKELKRVEITTYVIQDYLKKILERTPSINGLDNFYYELIGLIVNREQMKKSLGAVNWAMGQTGRLTEIYKRKLKGAQLKDMARIRKEHYGRVSSILKQINSDLLFLDDCRRSLRNLAKVKDMETIVIAGFPNIGKSSILKHLTGALPEVQPYPFTTQNLMLGYIEDLLQFIDAPGILDRDLKLRNKIELKAVLALKYLADKILFVFDLSETCGYSAHEQLNLYNEIKESFDIPIIVCINKIDITDKERLRELKKKIKKEKFFELSCAKKEGFDKLKKFLLKGAYLNEEKIKSFRDIGA